MIMHYINMKYRKLRILIGIQEIANNIKTIQEALQESGHSVDSVVIKSSAKRNKYYSNNKYTYHIGVILKYSKVESLLNKLFLVFFFLKEYSDMMCIIIYGALHFFLSNSIYFY